MYGIAIEERHYDFILLVCMVCINIEEHFYRLRSFIRSISGIVYVILLLMRTSTG